MPAATAVWEFRADGSNNNGGGFDPGLADGASVDYTQSKDPILSLTDLACTGGVSQTVTSETGGFTTAMRGNFMYISSGTGFTAGWYGVAWVDDAHTAVLDNAPAASGAASGGVCCIGGARQFPTTAFCDFIVGGNVCWYKYGTYSITAPITDGNNGTPTSGPIQHLGYNTVRGDTPKGANRPTLAFTSTNNWNTSIQHQRIENLIITGSNGSNPLMAAGFNSFIKNCKVVNSGGGSAISSYTVVYGCEVSATGAGYGIQSALQIEGCYVHGGSQGVRGAFSTISNSIISNCVQGVNNTGGSSGQRIDRCIIYGSSSYGVYGTTTYPITISNSIIANCATGLYRTTKDYATVLSNLCWWGNSTDIALVSGSPCSLKGSDNINADPLFVDIANGNFNLRADSPCLNKEAPLSWAASAGSWPLNIGADQGDHSAAGGNPWATYSQVE